MSKVWFTSDLHIGHKKIVEYTNRGAFTSQETHDQDIIDLWNSQVSKHDVVYQLGDFVFNCRDVQEWERVVDKLNGRIIHFRGNHCSKDVLERSGREWYDLKRVKVGSQQIVMCHFAMRVWDMYHYGAWHIYGHSHGSLPGIGRSIDVGLDNAYNVFGEHKFFSLDDLRDLIGTKEIQFNDHHKNRM